MHTLSCIQRRTIATEKRRTSGSLELYLIVEHYKWVPIVCIFLAKLRIAVRIGTYVVPILKQSS